MSFGGGGSGTQQTTTTQSKSLPQWEQEPAKEYLASLMNYVFPGSQVPQSWFSTKGYSFPTGGVSDVAGASTGATGGPGGGNAGLYAAGQQMQQLDPTGTAYGMLAPMISGSPFLQNLAAQNPSAITGAMSPMAASQLGGLYGGSFTGSPQASVNAANVVNAMGGIPQAPTPVPAPAPAPAPAAKPAAKKKSNPLAGNVLADFYDQQTPEQQAKIDAQYAQPQTQKGRGTAR